MKNNYFLGLFGISLICFMVVDAKAKTVSMEMFRFQVPQAINGTNACAPLMSKVTGTAAEQKEGCTKMRATTQVRSGSECVPTEDYVDGDWVCNGGQGEPGDPGQDACASKVTTESGSGANAGCTRVVITPQIMSSDGCIDDPDGQTTSGDWICKGCTPTYTKTYINKNGNNITYNNAERTTATIGERVTMSDCTPEPITMDTYDGEDGEGADLCNGSTSHDDVKITNISYSISPKPTGVNYHTERGRVTTSRQMCDDQPGDALIYEDPCVEVPRGDSGCNAPNVYKQCKPADGGAAYYVCEAGTSILDVASNALSTAQAADQCYQNETSSTIERSSTRGSYNRGTKTDATNVIYSQRGKTPVVSTKCDNTTQTTYEVDQCTEVKKPTDVCTGSSYAYMKCAAQASAGVAEDSTYYVCENLGSDTSLVGYIDAEVFKASTGGVTEQDVRNMVTEIVGNSSFVTTQTYDTYTAANDAAVAGKLDAADVTQTYLTNKLGTALSGKLDASSLGTALKAETLKTDLSAAVTASGALSNYATTAQLETAQSTLTAAIATAKSEAIASAKNYTDEQVEAGIGICPGGTVTVSEQIEGDRTTYTVNCTKEE